MTLISDCPLYMLFSKKSQRLKPKALCWNKDTYLPIFQKFIWIQLGLVRVIFQFNIKRYVIHSPCIDSNWRFWSKISILNSFIFFYQGKSLHQSKVTTKLVYGIWKANFDNWFYGPPVLPYCLLTRAIHKVLQPCKVFKTMKWMS